MSRRITAVALGAVVLASAACSSYRTTTTRSLVLRQKVQSTVDAMVGRDPGLTEFLETCYGYAVFPAIGKGAVGIGAAHGEGEVYEQGRFIGWSEMTQGIVGLALGGQVYSEIIFFEDAAALAEFKRDDLRFSGNASAVAVEAGASSAADYDDGVAVFTMPRGGLMFEASIGGQSFEFFPKTETASAPGS